MKNKKLCMYEKLYILSVFKVALSFPTHEHEKHTKRLGVPKQVHATVA